MHILITGNQGFIGPVLTRLAREAGHRTTGLDIGYFEDCVSPLTPDILPDRQIVRDIRDVKAEDLEGVDAVIHLAGLSNDPMGALNPDLTYDINLEATAGSANWLGTQASPASSSPPPAPSMERPVTKARWMRRRLQSGFSAYAISKVRSEERLSALASDTFSPVFMRNATAYGVSSRTRFDLVVNNLSGWAHTAGIIKVMSDGTPWRPLVHIEDISRAACRRDRPARDDPQPSLQCRPQ